MSDSLGDMSNVFVGTFHAFSLHWLRECYSNLNVAGPETRIWILKSIYPDLKSAELRAYNKEISLFFRNRNVSSLSHPDSIKKYLAVLAEQGLVDLDAIIGKTVEILENDEIAGQKMREQTGSVFIDEFQDLNLVQYECIRLLSRTNNIFAIGDPDQAIYGFRGSDPAFFYQFINELHPEVHTLTEHYRCSATILQASQQLIVHNRSREKTELLHAVRKQVGKIYYYNSTSEKNEAHFIVQQIEQIVGGTCHLEIDRISDADVTIRALGDIAVLYRTSRQARVIAARMEEQGIPFQVVDIIPYYMKGPIKYFYLLTLIAAGMAESAEVLALLELQKNIGAKGIRAVEKLLPLQCKNPWSFLLKYYSENQHLPSRLSLALFELQKFLERFTQLSENHSIAFALRDALANFEMGSHNSDRDRFVNLSVSFGTSLCSFARHLQQYRDTVVYDQNAESVTLMTMHAAKGLEFPVVFIAGAEEGITPLEPLSLLSSKEKEIHLEEERRLFFVGMTRAADILFISNASSRIVYGKLSQQSPSRFLSEIPAELLEKSLLLKGKKKPGKSSFQQLSLF